MSDYDHRDLDEPEGDDEDRLHGALDSDEDAEPEPRAKTSSGDADDV